MVRNQSQDLNPLVVTARAAQPLGLQLPEGFGHLGEGRAIAQGIWLALDDSEIVPPVIECPPRLVMGPIDDTGMFTQDHLQNSGGHCPVNQTAPRRGDLHRLQ